MRKTIVALLLLCLAMLPACTLASEEIKTTYINGVIVEVSPDGTLLFNGFNGVQYRLLYRSEADAPAVAVGQVVRAAVETAPEQPADGAPLLLLATALDECWVEAAYVARGDDHTTVHIEGPAIGNRWIAAPDGTSLYNTIGAHFRFRPVLVPGTAPEDMKIMADAARICYAFTGSLVTRQADSLVIKGQYEELRVLIGPDTVIYREPSRWHETTVYITSIDTSVQPHEALAWSIW